MEIKINHKGRSVHGALGIGNDQIYEITTKITGIIAKHELHSKCLDAIIKEFSGNDAELAFALFFYGVLFHV